MTGFSSKLIGVVNSREALTQFSILLPSVSYNSITITSYSVFDSKLLSRITFNLFQSTTFDSVEMKVSNSLSLLTIFIFLGVHSISFNMLLNCSSYSSEYIVSMLSNFIFLTIFSFIIDSSKFSSYCVAHVSDKVVHVSDDTSSTISSNVENDASGAKSDSSNSSLIDLTDTK